MASLVRGRGAQAAKNELAYLPKRASEPLQKLLQSAVANAKALGANEENLFIQELSVDKGPTYKRMMPAAMGAAHRINKRTSRIRIVLGERELKVESQKSKVKRNLAPKA